MKNNKYIYALIFVGLLIGLAILPACANMGHPSGGPYDMTPPVFVGATPKMKATNVNVNEKKISLYFDENIKIEDPSKIIITPLQVEQPDIFANGKRIKITFIDSIKPKTTYGLFFNDAIVDNNEDNPLDDFYYCFSTGDSIDSMRISGVVLDAETLEPVDMLTIGAYPVDSIYDDSLEMKQPFILGSKTNKMGNFTIFALAKKKYKVSAINDIDQNFKLSKQGEGFAQYKEPIIPYLIDSTKIDTIRRDSISAKGDTIHIDSTVKKSFTYYFPKDIVLRYYMPEEKRCGLKESKLIDSTQIVLEFVENLDTIPHINLLGTKNINKDFYIPSIDANKVTYWIKDKNMVKDSIAFSIFHSKNDSLLNVYNAIDTITLFKPKNSKQDTIIQPLNIEIKQTEGLYKNTPKDSLFITLSQPVVNLDSSSVRFQKIVDSSAVDVPIKILKHKNNELRYDIISKLDFDCKYKISIDSAKIKSLYALTNKKTEKELKILSEKELASLSLSIKNIDSTAICQLLDNQGNVIESKKITAMSEKELAEKAELTLNKDSINKALSTLPIDSSLIKDSIKDSTKLDTIKKKNYNVIFENINPAKYYVRLFIDSNNDGKWTTGTYPKKEPEMMYYCNMVFDLKKGMTTQEAWDVTAIPLNEQKPLEIRKVKPEEKKKRVDKNIEYYKNLNSGGPVQSNSVNDMNMIDPRNLF